MVIIKRYIDYIADGAGVAGDRAIGVGAGVAGDRASGVGAGVAGDRAIEVGAGVVETVAMSPSSPWSGITPIFLDGAVSTGDGSSGIASGVIGIIVLWMISGLAVSFGTRLSESSNAGRGSLVSNLTDLVGSTLYTSTISAPTRSSCAKDSAFLPQPKRFISSLRMMQKAIA